VREDDRLYVHAEASAPEDWSYVISVEDAARSTEMLSIISLMASSVKRLHMASSTASDGVPSPHSKE
jgi:hypothetical protein